MTWKRENSSLPLEIFLKPQESANARRFSFAVAGTISWTVCLCVSVCVASEDLARKICKKNGKFGNMWKLTDS